jgi:hypothetical protein
VTGYSGVLAAVRWRGMAQFPGSAMRPFAQPIDLKSDHPIVAPNYAAQRSALAGLVVLTAKDDGRFRDGPRPRP